LKHPLQDIERI